MNDSEFDQWLAGYLAVFPDFRNWFVNIDPTAKREMISSWREALADVELRDAKAVTSRIVSGDDAPIQAYERELTAAHIRRLSKSNFGRRSERSRRQEKSDSKRCRPAGESAGQLYRKMLKLLDDHPDMTPREAAEQVFPAGVEEDQRRFDCYLCLDSGIVLVWSERSVRAAIDGTLDDPNNRRSCGAPCSCRRGESKIWTNENPPKSWAGWLSRNAVYTEQRYCLCARGDTERAEGIDELKDWAAVRFLEWQNRRREPAFVQWNAGGNI